MAPQPSAPSWLFLRLMPSFPTDVKERLTAIASAIALPPSTRSWLSLKSICTRGVGSGDNWHAYRHVMAAVSWRLSVQCWTHLRQGAPEFERGGDEDGVSWLERPILQVKCYLLGCDATE
eukprot:7382268-Prymnesium_polylepis.3